MLPATSRLTTRRDFSETLRRGPGSVRVANKHVVLHAAPPAKDSGSGSSGPVVDVADGARVGFIVSRAVGPAVIRNRVRRRLRAIVGECWSSVPTGRLVVRVLPAAREASYQALESSFTTAIADVARRRDRRR